MEHCTSLEQHDLAHSAPVHGGLVFVQFGLQVHRGSEALPKLTGLNKSFIRLATGFSN